MDYFSVKCGLFFGDLWGFAHEIRHALDDRLVNFSLLEVVLRCGHLREGTQEVVERGAEVVGRGRGEYERSNSIYFCGRAAVICEIVACICAGVIPCCLPR